MDPYQPRKTVGKLKPQHPVWDELELLNEVVEFVTQKTGAAPLTMQELGDGHAPIRRRVGRPEPR